MPLGNVTNPNDGYSAVIYGDRGFLKIAGDKDTPVAVPEGEWKLLSYSINRSRLRPSRSNPTRRRRKRRSKERKDAAARTR